MVYFVRIVALTLAWGFGIPAGIAKDLPGNEGARRLQEAGISLGDALPDLTVHDAQGLPFPLQNLYGKYAVIVFGCMTCPVFLARASGYEAVFRDYSPKGVRFYFVYKSLAHPEYGEGFVAPSPSKNVSSISLRLR